MTSFKHRVRRKRARVNARKKKIRIRAAKKAHR